MFEKVLSKNDVSQRGHQSGFLVLKKQAIGRVFLNLMYWPGILAFKLKLLNWHTGDRLDAKFIHYNNTHDEYRVTGLKRWFVSAGITNGDILEIKKVSGEEVILLS